MKTPRQACKENFWIGAKGGLLDLKHINAMKDAVWFFLYLIRGQTGINPAGEGIFQYGRPVTKEQISDDFNGLSFETLKRWISILKAGRYIRTEFHSNHGTTFWIAKAKNKTRKMRISTEEARELHAKLHPNSCVNPPVSLGNSCGAPPLESENSSGDRAEETLQSIERQALAAPIPKDFISKSLSNYNKDAAAQAAAGIPSLLSETARQLQTPRQKSARELDERRRQLLFQAERIKRDYQSSGKVRVIA
jgi:hypothetical protein